MLFSAQSTMEIGKIAMGKINDYFVPSCCVALSGMMVYFLAIIIPVAFINILKDEETLG